MAALPKNAGAAKPEKPYSIHDGQGVRVQRFASYGEAERAATAWCREKQAPVDVRRRRTHLATALPQSGRAPLVEMTWAGSAYA
ncbi:hypothetical protein HW511_00375 [Asaia siamensis]|uniref:Uncharacterized protein n=1 Tax=Asaia siamensis TaxID=110479 RepID=A0ABQ1M703_9PROT|nr:hypothetical protein [Asaia siamensis]GBR06343.1 hypothetical protein AA0323_1359 [Asaia siamensis NRIC 0323]GGC34398.1 hypothetical protein GCM10007207_19930 [Asaia siamensis]